jgi:hypothetical protein
MRLLILIPIIAIALLLACRDTQYLYPKNRNIANHKGLPLDSSTNYFSIVDPDDSTQVLYLEDHFFSNFFSSSLYAFKEPVLYNDYLGKEIYRFLYDHSFEITTLFILSKENDVITLQTKKLDGRFKFGSGLSMKDSSYFRLHEHIPIALKNSSGLEFVYEPSDPHEIAYYKLKGFKIPVIDSFSERTALASFIKDTKRSLIVFDSTINVKKRDWDQFEDLIEAADFWDLPSYVWEGNTDGAAWVIEAHRENRYKYLLRQSPGGSVEKIGNFLMNLSGLKR